MPHIYNYCIFTHCTKSLYAFSKTSGTSLGLIKPVKILFCFNIVCGMNNGLATLQLSNMNYALTFSNNEMKRHLLVMYWHINIKN